MSIPEINQLKNLDFTKQLAFAYLACERLYPNYIYFSDNYNFGKPSVLREAIDYLYCNFFENSPDKNTIALLIKKIDENTPDTENYGIVFASAALDACTAIQDSLDFMIDKDFKRIEYILTYLIDTVQMYIQEIECLDSNKDKDFQQKIDNHPLMKKEFAIQLGILVFLNNSKTFNFEDLQTLLHLQDNNMKGSLNL